MSKTNAKLNISNACVPENLFLSEQLQLP